MNRRTSNQAGFTLPEVLIASAILAYAVAAITYAISTGHAQTYNALHELRALSLAESLMEEIVAKPYVDPQGAGAVGGPDEGEASRADFDNCDDYHGFTETIGNLHDAQGAAYPAAFAPYSRSVTAVYENLSFTALGETIAGLTVTVTVTDDHGRSWQAARFIAESQE